jgi:hypothetical protein
MEVLKEDRERRAVTLRFNATAESNLSSTWNMLPVEVDLVVDGQDRCVIKTFRTYHPIESASQFNPFGR